MDKNQIRELIACRVAKELKPNTLVNLGIGLPTAVAKYVDPDANIIFHSENGILGVGSDAGEGEINKDLTNAGGAFVTTIAGASFLDSATCFAVCRGGRLDVTVLGALQVDAQGDLANWLVPDKVVPGMGGAMDLATGARQVIIALEHTAKGAPKILDKCTLPLTAKGVVSKIITELAVISVSPEGLVLEELQGNATIEEVQAATDAYLIIPEKLKRCG